MQEEQWLPYGGQGATLAHQPAAPPCSARPTFVQVHVQDLLLPEDLPAVAGQAAVQGPHPLPVALALRAHGLDVVHHVGAQLVHHDLHAGAVALGAARVQALPAATPWGETTGEGGPCSLRGPLPQGLLPRLPLAHRHSSCR